MIQEIAEATIEGRTGSSDHFDLWLVLRQQILHPRPIFFREPVQTTGVSDMVDHIEQGVGSVHDKACVDDTVDAVLLEFAY